MIRQCDNATTIKTCERAASQHPYLCVKGGEVLWPVMFWMRQVSWEVLGEGQ